MKNSYENDRLLDDSRHNNYMYHERTGSDDTLAFYDVNEERYIKQRQYKDFETSNIIVWSFAESMCCDTENKLLNYLIITITLPVILFSFVITLLGRIIHDIFDQSKPVRDDESPWERKVRIQGVISTSGLMLLVILLEIAVIIYKSVLSDDKRSHDMTVVYITSSVTIVANICVIVVNVLYLHAMKNSWSQTTKSFISSMWGITLSQVAMTIFDSLLLLSGDPEWYETIIWSLHLCETLYSFLQSILYQSMWNYYDKKDGVTPTDEREMVYSINIGMIASASWACLFIGFRFTSLATYKSTHIPHDDIPNDDIKLPDRLDDDTYLNPVTTARF